VIDARNKKREKVLKEGSRKYGSRLSNSSCPPGKRGPGGGRGGGPGGIDRRGRNWGGKGEKRGGFPAAFLPPAYSRKKERLVLHPSGGTGDVVTSYLIEGGKKKRRKV